MPDQEKRVAEEEGPREVGGGEASERLRGGGVERLPIRGASTEKGQSLNWNHQGAGRTQGKKGGGKSWTV